MADSEQQDVRPEIAPDAAAKGTGPQPAEPAAAPARAPRKRTAARKTATRRPAGTRSTASSRAVPDSAGDSEAAAKPSPRRRTTRKTAARVPKARAASEPTATASPDSEGATEAGQPPEVRPEPVRLVPAPAVERTHDSTLSEFLPAVGTPAPSNTDLTLAAARASAAAAAARARSSTRTADRPPRLTQPEGPAVRVVGDAVEPDPAPGGPPTVLVDDFGGQQALEETPTSDAAGPTAPAETITGSTPVGMGGDVGQADAGLRGGQPALATASPGGSEPPGPAAAEPADSVEAPEPELVVSDPGDSGHDSAAEPVPTGPVAGGDSTGPGPAAHTLSAAGSASAEPRESAPTAASTAVDPTDNALEAAAVEYTATREAPARPSTPAPVPAPPEAQEARMSRADAPAPRARARHAHLYVTHVDPWSVMKNAFMLAVAIGIVVIVAVMVLWSMLSLSGTLDAITRTVSDIAGGSNSLDAASIFSFSRVVGVAAVLAVLEIVLLTALATLFAFLYNLSVGVTGGLQVTLTDDS